MNVDIVAEAIWKADPSGYDMERWAWLSDDLRDGYRRMAEAAIEAMGWQEIPKDVDYYDSPAEAIDNALNRSRGWPHFDEDRDYILAKLHDYGFKIVRDMTMEINQPHEA